MSESYKDIIVNTFTEESAAKFREQVINKAIQNPDVPITIYIDSYGGYLDSLNSMLETIEQVPNPIITVCTGKAMSCGAVLLSVGDYRFCGRHSRVMVHQGSSGMSGPIEGQQNDVNESKRLNKKLMTMIAARCSMSLADFKILMKSKLTNDDDEARDMYLSAESALEIGIVDFVGMPHIEPIVQYAVKSAPEKEYKFEKPKKKVKKKKAKKKKAKKKAKKS